MPKVSQTEKRDRLHAVIRGIERRFTEREKLVFLQERFTRKSLVARFQEHIAALDAIEAARLAYAQAVARERAMARGSNELTYLLRGFVAARFGVKREVYGDFGWPVPKKPGPKSAASKAGGVEKARATRAAAPSPRHSSPKTKPSG